MHPRFQDLDNTLTRTKWVRVMADFCSNGIWTKGGSMADLDDLPVDADTIFMLGAWQQWYDARNADDPIPQLDKFVSYGLKIVRDIQRQLPDWTVAYFDEAKQQTYINVSLYLRAKT